MGFSKSFLKKSHLASQLLLTENNKINEVDIIKKLGFLQIDSIYSIARSQDLVLHTRKKNYQEETIWNKLEKGKLIEGWAHARCLLPIEDFRYQYSFMLKRRSLKPDWLKLIKEKNWQKKILKQVENEGPISSSSLNPVKIDLEFSGWNTTKKRLLDYLFYRGYLAVRYRKKLKVFYDLPENCIPNFYSVIDNLPTVKEEVWHNIESTLNANGIVDYHRLINYRYLPGKIVLEKEKKTTLKSMIQRFVKNGKLNEIKIDGFKYPLYYLPQHMEILEAKLNTEKLTLSFQFLSPFDNALWSREALLEQYRFNFKMEIYVPKSKRKYGYFVLPILYGSEMIGRVDVKFHRKEKIFQFIKWTFEKKFTLSEIHISDLATAINHIANFHKADSINLGNFPKGLTNNLRQITNFPIKKI